MIPLLISSYLVCAVPPPPAFINGPLHEPAYLALFRTLEEGAWRSAELRYGERSNGHRAIIIGSNRALREAFRAAGWAILEPPYQAKSATLVFYLPHLGGNVSGMRRITADLATWIRPGGFFVVPAIELRDFIVHPDITDFKAADAFEFVMSPFKRRLGGIRVMERDYDVWQRNMRRSA